ncbi:hypothetical protein FRC12_013963 [Ceratobasidium sp. 428]|nr:hypothetical protein FRC12_013963 [Ceratobasidium sp. 428]
MLLSALSAAVLLVPSALGAVVWDGRLNDYSSATDFDKWSWSSQVGTYQTYIYGNQHGEKASSWYTLGSQYKNPASMLYTLKFNAYQILKETFVCVATGQKQGVKTTASLSGHLYYHVSLQIPTVNPPSPDYEHQIVFWEGHYADIKYGRLSGQTGNGDVLQVITGGKTIWSVTPVKGTWYNFILETGSPGGLWVSTGSAKLTKVYSGSLNGNGGTDWHVGMLRLPNGNTNTITEENIYYSGVYVENSGPTTTP